MGIGVNLAASLTVSSSVAIQSALFRSLNSSLSISSGLGRHISLSRSLTGSWTLDSSLAQQTSISNSGSLPITTVLLLIVLGMAGGFFIMFVGLRRGWGAFCLNHPDKPPPDASWQSSLEPLPQETPPE